MEGDRSHIQSIEKGADTCTQQSKVYARHSLFRRSQGRSPNGRLPRYPRSSGLPSVEPPDHHRLPKTRPIGADRLANAAAAFLEFSAPAIVIDFGTAVTFDVISQNGAYLGGVIAPGTASLRDYLHTKTALLPAIQLAEPSSIIGRSTEEAMQVGAVIGYRGLIREILNAICSELGGHPTIIATGGDSALISRGLDAIQHLDQDLTMKGIQAIGRANHKISK